MIGASILGAIHPLLAVAVGATELIEWLRRMPSAPRHAYITHGEASASDVLRQRIQTDLGWNASVPEYRDEVELT